MLPLSPLPCRRLASVDVAIRRVALPPPPLTLPLPPHCRQAATDIALSRFRHRRSLRAAATALPPSRSFEPKALQRRSTYGRNRLAHRKMDIMLGTRLCAGITIEIRMRPRPLYAFRVILLMPRYAYAAYPTVYILYSTNSYKVWFLYQFIQFFIRIV